MITSQHPEYLDNLCEWSSARDLLAGERAVKAAGETYLPRLADQTDDEYNSYRGRATFFNATARTADGYVGLVYRHAPIVRLPESLGPFRGITYLEDDADLAGTPLAMYARNILRDTLTLGRCGTVVDWAEEGQGRAVLARYSPENIWNWRVERVNGRTMLTLLVLYEPAGAPAIRGPGQDRFSASPRPQIRVYQIVPDGPAHADPDAPFRTPRAETYHCRIELWRKATPETQATDPAWRSVGPAETSGKWQLHRTIIPMRGGEPLPFIPFVPHNPNDLSMRVAKSPLADVMAVNLDHYRLDADYKHGMHFTALPTAWVSGFGATPNLRLGSVNAWVAEQSDARAGFLEYTGQGLSTFERALDRDERLLAVLGARLLENQKKVGETAEAIELRQFGENSILGSIAQTVAAGMTKALKMCCWWGSRIRSMNELTREQVGFEFNTDFSTRDLSAQKIEAIVAAWQAGAITKESMSTIFRSTGLESVE